MYVYDISALCHRAKQKNTVMLRIFQIWYCCKQQCILHLRTKRKWSMHWKLHTWTHLHECDCGPSLALIHIRHHMPVEYHEILNILVTKTPAKNGVWRWFGIYCREATEQRRHPYRVKRKFTYNSIDTLHKFFKHHQEVKLYTWSIKITSFWS